MPKSGEVNSTFGIFESICCGSQIALSPGVTFPDCAQHLRLMTEWKDVTYADGDFPSALQWRDDSAA
jgi:hypothetical protein